MTNRADKFNGQFADLYLYYSDFTYRIILQGSLYIRYIMLLYAGKLRSR
jgi:hypothetical protein